MQRFPYILISDRSSQPLSSLIMSATQDNEEPCGRGFGGDVANPLAWSPMRPEPASRSIEDIQQTISKMQRMYEITGATHYLNQGIALSEQTLGSVEPNGDDDARLQGVIRSLFFETSSFTRGNARELAKLAQVRYPRKCQRLCLMPTN